MQFHIEDMVCGGCVKGVTRAIQSIDASAAIETSPETRKVVVTSDSPAEAFLPALEQAGFAARID